MTDILASLHRDHANLAKLLDVLERQVDAFDRGERPDYDAVQGVIDYCLTYPDLYHHPKEDLVFERLRLRDPESAVPVGDLLGEHRELAELTRRFAAAVHNVLHEAEVPRQAFDHLARDFIAAYRRHMAGEDSVFFPAAERALTAQDWADLAARMREREDPVFGTETEERFQALREEILRWVKDEEGSAH